MDANDLRGITTLIVMVAFIGVCIWAYSSKRKSRFDEASQLPFSDEETPENNKSQEKQTHE